MFAWSEQPFRSATRQPTLQRNESAAPRTLFAPMQFPPLAKPLQKIQGNESEDRRYDFLFPTAAQTVLKLSEMNALNPKKLSEIAPNYPNFAESLKSLADKIEASAATLSELQKRSEETNARLTRSIEQRIKECLLTAKKIDAKTRIAAVLLQSLNAECELFAESLKAFNESFSRIKSDTKLYYEHPSRPLIAALAAVRAKVEMVRFAMSDIAALMELPDEPGEEESDNLQSYISIVEDLNYYFQIVVKRANDVCLAVRATRARALGNSAAANAAQSAVRGESRAASDNAQRRIQELMERLETRSQL